MTEVICEKKQLSDPSVKGIRRCKLVHTDLKQKNKTTGSPTARIERVDAKKQFKRFPRENIRKCQWLQQLNLFDLHAKGRVAQQPARSRDEQQEQLPRFDARIYNHNAVQNGSYFWFPE
jgi:hypothetical protein